MLSFKDYLTEQEEKAAEYKTRVFRVPVDHLQQLEDKIKKANKTAAKLGCKPAVINYLERKFEKVKGDFGNEVDMLKAAFRGEKFREYQYLTVTGEVPVLAGGWSFAGKLEPHESGTIVKSAPGHTLPTKYQHADPMHCEHCKKQRRRNETFVVKKGARTYRQVGRACLKDFLGHDNPEKFAQQAEWIYDLENQVKNMENDGWGGGRWNPSFGTKEMLAAAHAAIQRGGFVGSNHPDYSKERTSQTTNKHFNPPTGESAKYHVPLIVTKENEEQAEATIKWIKEKAKTDKSEFFQNLNKFVTAEANNLKYTGYLAAAAMMYQKEEGQLVARKKMSDGIKDEAVGKEGEKVKLQAEVIGAFRYQRQSYHYYDNGVSQILTMKDSDGHLIKMFTTNLDVKKGDKVTLSGKLGKAEPEKYENSPFKGKIVTMMAPRTRIEVVPEQSDLNKERAYVLSKLKSISGKQPPQDITGAEIVPGRSTQWETTIRFFTKKQPEGYIKTFDNSEIEWNA